MLYMKLYRDDKLERKAIELCEKQHLSNDTLTKFLHYLVEFRENIIRKEHKEEEWKPPEKQPVAILRAVLVY